MTYENLDLDLRYRTLKYYVCCVLSYGVETWTMETAIVKKLEVFEMWTLRRMMRISWVDHGTNRNVLRKVGLVDREPFENIKKRITGYFTHNLTFSRSVENLNSVIFY